MKIKHFLQDLVDFDRKKSKTKSDEDNDEVVFSFEKVVILSDNKDDGLVYGFSTKSIIDTSSDGLALLLEKREPRNDIDPYFNKNIKEEDWVLYANTLYSSAKRYEDREFRAQLPGHKIVKVKDYKFEMVSGVCQIRLVLF